MKKQKRKMFLGFLFILFMVFGASTAYACLVLTDAQQSLSADGPWTDEDDPALDVCAGDTFYVQVEVDDYPGCPIVGTTGDNWEATRISYRLNAASGPFTTHLCDIVSTNYTSGDHTVVFEVTAPDIPTGPSPQLLDIRVEIFNVNDCESTVDDDDTDNNVINIYRNPDATITNGDDSVCAGATGLTASVPDAGAGATYAWGVTGGTITGGQGTTQITWDADQGDGTATVSVDVTNAGGCIAQDTADVTVNALPVCDITVDDVVCAGKTDLTASVASAGEGAAYTWGITNGTITGGAGTNQITWTAGAVSPVTLTIEITDSNGCTCSDSVDVAVQDLPVCTITAPTTVIFGSTGNTASTVDSTPAGYAWVIYVDGVLNNGLITAGQDTNQITWTAPVSFTQIDIGVTVTAGMGCVCENDPPVGGGSGGVVVTGTSQSGSIPTLSEWGMIILGLLMAGTAVIAMRRKNNMTV